VYLYVNITFSKLVGAFYIEKDKNTDTMMILEPQMPVEREMRDK
jgi:hypothetical protein